MLTVARYITASYSQASHSCKRYVGIDRFNRVRVRVGCTCKFKPCNIADSETGYWLLVKRRRYSENSGIEHNLHMYRVWWRYSGSGRHLKMASVYKI